MIKKYIKYITHPSLFLSTLSRKIRERKLSANEYQNIFDNDAELHELTNELYETGIIDTINERIKQFDDVKDITIRGNKADSGVMSRDEGVALYAITRKIKPNIVVETGVCSGYSTALILKAMELNNHGTLYSIDFPEELDKEYTEGEFWSGKGSAVVPPGKTSGWLIPEELYKRWKLQLGKTQDLLEPLLDDLGTIDVFIHDSEHSYECMTFEYTAAWRKLDHNGYLISDDIGWNNAFLDFAQKVKATPGKIIGNMGIIKKNTGT